MIIIEKSTERTCTGKVRDKDVHAISIATTNWQKKLLLCRKSSMQSGNVDWRVLGRGLVGVRGLIG